MLVTMLVVHVRRVHALSARRSNAARSMILHPPLGGDLDRQECEEPEQTAQARETARGSQRWWVVLISATSRQLGRVYTH